MRWRGRKGGEARHKEVEEKQKMKKSKGDVGENRGARGKVRWRGQMEVG